MASKGKATSTARSSFSAHGGRKCCALPGLFCLPIAPIPYPEVTAVLPAGGLRQHLSSAVVDFKRQLGKLKPGEPVWEAAGPA